MRRSDIMFLGTIFSVVFVIFASLIFSFKLPNWFTFWWVIFLPFIFLKLFFRNTNLFRWFNEDIQKKEKNDGKNK